MAVIVTVVFALQLMILDRWRVGTWGGICEGLAIALAFVAAKEAGACACVFCAFRDTTTTVDL